MDAILISTSSIIIQKFTALETKWETDFFIADNNTTSYAVKNIYQQRIIQLHLQLIECVRVFNKIFSEILIYDFMSTIPYVCSQLGGFIRIRKDKKHEDNLLSILMAHYSWMSYFIRIILVIWFLGKMHNKVS